MTPAETNLSAWPRGKSFHIALAVPFTTAIGVLFNRAVSKDPMRCKVSELSPDLGTAAWGTRVALTFVRAFRFVCSGAKLPLTRVFTTAVGDDHD
jgi:hypothetical protein